MSEAAHGPGWAAAAVIWIPVGDQMPDEEITVLVATSTGEVDMAYLDEEKWWSTGYPFRVTDVTHWADLPLHPHDAMPREALKKTARRKGGLA